MMMTIKLHPEVVKFLNETGAVWIEGNEEKSFIVNNSWYKSTEEEGIYTVQFLEA
jgi:hypothetical protein